MVTVNYAAANNGNHTIRAVVTDTSGNVSEDSAALNVSIGSAATDTAKPTLTLSLNPSTINSSTWTSLTLSGTAQDNVAVKNVELSLSVNGQSYPLGTATPDSKGAFSLVVTPSTFGSLTISAVAVDTAGNRSDVAAQTLNITH